MRFRKLRIAWSVGCGVACVLLIVLWLRSYRTFDAIGWPVTSRMNFQLQSGIGSWHINATEQGRPITSLELQSVDIPDGEEIRTALRNLAPSGFALRYSYNSCFICFPQWLPVLIMAAIGAAAAPLIRCRFSLRTLLIATTLTSMVLGMAAYAARH
jgi:hypothetical protein